MLRTIAVAAALLATPAPLPSHLTLTYPGATVRLTCDPTGGSHPEAVQACAALRRVDADPARIKPAPLMCMTLYAPVTARITGTWRGGRVKWSHRYGNTCEMTRATGVLFKF